MTRFASDRQIPYIGGTEPEYPPVAEQLQQRKLTSPKIIPSVFFYLNAANFTIYFIHSGIQSGSAELSEGLMNIQQFVEHDIIVPTNIEVERDTGATRVTTNVLSSAMVEIEKEQQQSGDIVQLQIARIPSRCTIPRKCKMNFKESGDQHNFRYHLQYLLHLVSFAVNSVITLQLSFL